VKLHLNHICFARTPLSMCALCCAGFTPVACARSFVHTTCLWGAACAVRAALEAGRWLSGQ